MWNESGIINEQIKIYGDMRYGANFTNRASKDVCR